MSMLSQEEVSSFLAKYKGRGGIVLGIIGRKKKYYDVLTSEVGETILSGVIKRMESLHEKIIEGDFTDEERVELKILRKITGEWTDHVSQYLAETEKVRLNKM